MLKLSLLIADAFFVLHFLLGGILLVGWFFPETRTLHLVLLIAWFSSWATLGYCPLTKWELMLRRRHDRNINTNAEFIQYYLYRFFGIRTLSRPIFILSLMFFMLLLALNLTAALVHWK